MGRRVIGMRWTRALDRKLKPLVAHGFVFSVVAERLDAPVTGKDYLVRVNKLEVRNMVQHITSGALKCVVRSCSQKQASTIGKPTRSTAKPPRLPLLDQPRLRFDARHQRGKAIRALRGQMFRQPQLGKLGHRVGSQDRFGGMTGQHLE